MVYYIYFMYFSSRSILARNQNKNGKERRKGANSALMAFIMMFSMTWQSWSHLSLKKRQKGHSSALMAFAMELAIHVQPVLHSWVRHEDMASAMDFEARRIATTILSLLPLQQISLSLLRHDFRVFSLVPNTIYSHKS